MDLGKFQTAPAEIEIIFKRDFLGHAMVAGGQETAALLHHREDAVYHLIYRLRALGQHTLIYAAGD